jgi:hypothetical protein
MDKLDQVANHLMEYETMNREEFEGIFPSPVNKNGGTPIPLAE